MTHTLPLMFVEWATADTRLRLVEPTTLELRTHAPLLADYYNEPTNRALMTNEVEFTAEDVENQFVTMRAEGGRPFLLFDQDDLMGDCDLRRVEATVAELAILVGSRARQAKGYGTRFSFMLVAFAFRELRLSKVYASVRPENAGSLRMFQKLRFSVDASPEARIYAEEDDDVCLSIDAHAFGEVEKTLLGTATLLIRER